MNTPRALRLSANNQDIIVDVYKLSRAPKISTYPPTCCWRSLFCATTLPTSSETLLSTTQIVNPRQCQCPQQPSGSHDYSGGPRFDTPEEFSDLTLTPLTWRIWWAPNNASRWHMEFNSALKGLKWYRNPGFGDRCCRCPHGSKS